MKFETLEEFLEMGYKSPGDARCNFCDGDMPCDCEGPESLDALMEEDLINRSKYDSRMDGYEY